MKKIKALRFSVNPLDYLILAILLITILAACTSCNTLKKQQRQEKKAEAFYNSNPDKLADKAAVMFPNITEGVTKGRIDTIRDIETISTAPGAPAKVRIIQTHSTDTLRLESGVKVAQLSSQVAALTAYVKELNKSVADYQKQALDLTKQKDFWRFWFILISIADITLIGLRYYLKLKHIV